MTGEQIRAARSLLGWTATNLAERSGISYPTIQRLDSTKGTLSGRHDTILAIRTTLSAAGIQFLDAGDSAKGAGVALVVAGEATDTQDT